MTGLLRYAPVLLILLALSFAGCASRDDVQILDARIQQTQQNTDKKLADMEAQLAQSQAELQETITRTNSPVRATQANIWSDLEQTRNRLAAMEGRLEVMERVLGDLQLNSAGNKELLARLAFETQAMRMAMVHELGVELPAPPAGLANATAAPIAAPANATDATAAAAAAATTAVAPILASPDDEPAETKDPAKALYDTAMESFKKREYAKAQRLWAEFGETFPKHYLAPNSWFWQGECYYQEGNYAQSVLAYQNVLDRFPKSNKYKTSLLKQGIAWYKLGKPDAGRLRLEDLIKRFPNTPEAKRAKAFLDKQ